MEWASQYTNGNLDGYNQDFHKWSSTREISKESL